MITYAIINEDNDLETTVTAESPQEAMRAARELMDDTDECQAIPWSTWLFDTVDATIAPIRSRLAALPAADLKVRGVGPADDDYLDGISGIYAGVDGVGQIQADREGEGQPRPVFHAHAAHDVETLLRAIDHLREHLDVALTRGVDL